jgi:RNA polymerase sigma factor (sigma-70 family)
MSATQALLSEYANGGSEKAFRELVSSYVDFVFSTALRIVGGDRPLAEDVTQTVFTDLARKAALLPQDVQLGGWLHRHTCFVARKTLRRERRRIAREKQAVEMHNAEDYTEANLAQVALVLDEAINDLSGEDRSAIVLRFFEGLDYRSIGEAIGSSEDAARMRVSRAVDKVGSLLKRRGIVLTAAGISFVLSGKLASAAPTGLATRIVYVELARAARGQGILRIVREAFFTRLNVGIVSAAVIVALVALLFSGRHTRAKRLPASDGKTFTPAEFADLAVEESDSQDVGQTKVARIEPEVSPVSSPEAGRPVVAPVQTVGVSVPRALPPQAAAQPAPIPSVPSDRGAAGPAVSGAQWNQNANASSQQRGISLPPRVAPQSLPPKVATNSTVLVNNSPNFNSQPGPWSPPTTIATVEAGTAPPNASANQSSVQPVRSTPRKRDRQP